MALAEVTGERATFARRDVAQAIARHLDVGGRGGEAAWVRSRVETLTDTLLARSEVVCLQAAERLDVPGSLVRRDGWSVWDAPQAVRYTTTEILAIESRNLHAAAIGAAAGVGRVEPRVLEQSLAVEPRRLGGEQVTALVQEDRAAEFVLLVPATPVGLLPAVGGEGRTAVQVARWRGTECCCVRTCASPRLRPGM